MQAERVRLYGRRLTLVLAGFAASVALLLVLASSAGAVVVRAANGQVFGVTPHAGVDPASIGGSVAAKHGASRFSLNGNLDYHDGPVLHSTAPYLIFWDPGSLIPDSSRTLYKRYLTDLAADSGKATNVFSVDRQFTDGAGFADYKQTFNPATQAISDTDAYPTTTIGSCIGHTNTTGVFNYPTCVTDTQLKQEIASVIAAHHLPFGIGADAPIYFVVTPTTVNVCFDASTIDPHTCADNRFCAFHSAFIDSSNIVLYSTINELVLGPGFNRKSCQFDGNTAVQTPNSAVDSNGTDVPIKYLSHEFSETITDPVAGTGWWDNQTLNEDGDLCNFAGPLDLTTGTNPNAFLPTLGGTAGAGTLFNQLINGNPYYSQSEWSNADVNCEMQPTSSAISASFTGPAGLNAAGAPLSFDASASTSAGGYSSVTWTFGDGSAPVFNPGSAAPTTTAHTYSASGNYAVTLTLVDTFGNLSTVTHNVALGYPPVSSFVATPARQTPSAPVAFNGSASSDPESGVTITSYSWNFGDGSAAGSGATTSHAYSTVGSYTVTLTVTNSLGLTGSSTRQVTIDEAPSAGFSVRTAHPFSGSPFGFDGSSSSDTDGSIVTYSWNFGDHTAAGSGARPSHSYRRSGTYTVTLQVTDSSGLTATVSHKVTVAPPSVVQKVSIKKNVLSIKLTGAGILTLNGKRFRIRRAETAKFKIVLSSSQSAKLRAAGKLKFKLTIRWQPDVGPRVRHTYTLVARR